jgi:hypothetical protein
MPPPLIAEYFFEIYPAAAKKQGNPHLMRVPLKRDLEEMPINSPKRR